LHFNSYLSIKTCERFREGSKKPHIADLLLEGLYVDERDEDQGIGLRGLGLLGGLALLGFVVSGVGLLMFSLSIAFSLIEFLLDRVAVVTWITRVGRNSKQNL
jgi:hypothetical protein